MTDNTTPAKVRLTDGLGPLPKPNAPPVFGYTSVDMLAYARREVASALDARKFVHAESSRIYARLAAAVRAGADDATLAQLLRDEVNARA